MAFGSREQHMEIFTGVGVALVSLFDRSGRVDLAATADLAADLAGQGMRGILVCGTTGEAGMLVDGERRAIISAIRAAVPADVPVLAGTGAPTAARAAQLTAEAVDCGADAVLGWPPPGSADLGGYFSRIDAAAQGRPVLAYHVPWVSSPGIPVGALGGLPVSGLKDSSGDPDRLLAEVTGYPGAIYTGSSALVMTAGLLGAAGAILAAANVEPGLCSQAWAGDPAAQRGLATVHAAVRSGGPAAVKRLLAERRGTHPLSRVGN